MQNDLISKSRVLEILDHAQIGAHDVDEFFQWASDIVEEEPTIAPDSLRERGEWQDVAGSNAFVCSRCGLMRITKNVEDKRYFKFCPSCGARMDLEG